MQWIFTRLILHSPKSKAILSFCSPLQIFQCRDDNGKYLSFIPTREGWPCVPFTTGNLVSAHCSSSSIKHSKSLKKAFGHGFSSWSGCGCCFAKDVTRQLWLIVVDAVPISSRDITHFRRGFVEWVVFVALSSTSGISSSNQVFLDDFLPLVKGFSRRWIVVHIRSSWPHHTVEKA